MSDRTLIYHCFKRHITHRPVSDNPPTTTSCDQCGDTSWLLGPRILEVETQEPVTLLNRSPWWTQQVPSECIMCSGSGMCGGMPCSCKAMRS